MQTWIGISLYPHNRQRSEPLSRYSQLSSTILNDQRLDEYLFETVKAMPYECYFYESN